MVSRRQEHGARLAGVHRDAGGGPRPTGAQGAWVQVHRGRGRHGQCGGVAHAHRARAEREAAELVQHQVKAERPPDHGLPTRTPRGFQNSRDAGARGPEAGRSCRTEPASEPVEPAEPVHSRLVAPLSQAPLAVNKGTGKMPAYVGSDQFGLVVAVQASIETARAAVIETAPSAGFCHECQYN